MILQLEFSYFSKITGYIAKPNQSFCDMVAFVQKGYTSVKQSDECQTRRNFQQGSRKRIPKILDGRPTNASPLASLFHLQSKMSIPQHIIFIGFSLRFIRKNFRGILFFWFCLNRSFLLQMCTTSRWNPWMESKSEFWLFTRLLIKWTVKRGINHVLMTFLIIAFIGNRAFFAGTSNAHNSKHSYCSWFQLASQYSSTLIWSSFEYCAGFYIFIKNVKDNVSNVLAEDDRVIGGLVLELFFVKSSSVFSNIVTTSSRVCVV